MHNFMQTKLYLIGGLPSGYFEGAQFVTIGSETRFWSSTEQSASSSWARYVAAWTEYSAKQIYPKTYAYSVRCVQN